MILMFEIAVRNWLRPFDEKSAFFCDACFVGGRVRYGLSVGSQSTWREL
jgi:hypothetical protein